MKKKFKKITRLVLALALCLTQVLPTFKVVADTTPTPISGRTSSDYSLVNENITGGVLDYDDATKVLDLAGSEIKKITVDTEEAYFLKLDINLPTGYIYDANANEVSYTIGESLNETVTLESTDDKITVLFDVLETLGLKENSGMTKLEIDWGQNFEIETLYLDLTDLVLYRIIEDGASSSSTEYLEVSKNSSGEYDLIYDSDTSSSYPELYLYYKGTGFADAATYALKVDMVYNPSFVTDTYLTSNTNIISENVTGEDLELGKGLEIKLNQYSYNGKYEFTVSVYDDTGTDLLDKLVYVVNHKGLEGFITENIYDGNDYVSNVFYSDDSLVTKNTEGIYEVKEASFPSGQTPTGTDQNVKINYTMGNINPDTDYIVIVKVNGVCTRMSQEEGGNFLNVLFEDSIDFSNKISGTYVYEVIVKDELGEKLVYKITLSYDGTTYTEDFSEIPTDENELMNFIINYNALTEEEKSLIANKSELDSLYINLLKIDFDDYVNGLNNDYNSVSNYDYKENILDVIMGYTVFGTLDTDGNMVYDTRSSLEVREELLNSVANYFRGATLALTITILDSEGNVLDDDQIVTTGSIFRVNFLESEFDYKMVLFGNAVSSDGTFSDGEIDLIVNNYISGESIDSYQEIAMDTNIDEEINVLDLTGLITLNEGGSF